MVSKNARGTLPSRATLHGCISLLENGTRHLLIVSFEAKCFLSFLGFMRILVVEDEIRLARQIASALTETGHDPAVVHDGESALDQAVQSSFDLIILDVGLPRMDGFEVLRRLRSQHVTSRVLMLTARGELKDRLAGLQLGGAAVTKGSNRPVTFAGKTSVTLPPGQSAWSDPIALSFVRDPDRTEFFALREHQFMRRVKERGELCLDKSHRPLVAANCQG